MRHAPTMMTEPVSVPTSGMSEKKNAMKARRIGNFAPMMVRKIALRMPFVRPRAAWPMTYFPTASVTWSAMSANRARLEAGTSW
jgi:hypothetical protein